MSEQLRGPGLEACPQCGESKKWYPQHWNKSASCTYPSLGDDLHHVVTGALMGDGSLEGTERAKLRVETTSREFALWLYEAFGPLAGGVRHYERDDPDNDVYRVSTLAHPELNRYRDWYRDGQKRIPERVRLRQLSALVFYCCDGNITFGKSDRPRITFKAVDDGYREDLAETLSRLEVGITPQPASDHVAIGADDVRRFLEWMGEPVPGKEHKWCLDRDTYLLAKRRVDRHEPTLEADMEWPDRYARVVELVTTARDEPIGFLRAEIFNESIGGLDASTVADGFAGGSWRGAQRQIRRSLRTSKSRKREYTRDDKLEAIRAAAADRGEPLSGSAYREWRRDRTAPTPAYDTIIQTSGFNGWEDACNKAGVDSVHEASFLSTEILKAIRLAADSMGEPLTMETYEEWRSKQQSDTQVPIPAAKTIQDSDSFAGWGDACEEANVESGTAFGRDDE